MAGKSRPDQLHAAFDELRFGARGTLNLRDGLPTAAAARARAETFLREHQVRGTKEVLIVTGRGNQSPGGVAVIRETVERLLFSLRRRGVILSHQEHNPGAFVARLAPIRALTEAPPRRREPFSARRSVSFSGLSPETTSLLHDLAECSLAALGVPSDDRAIEDEMHRQLGAIVPGLASGAELEDELRMALRSAIAEYD